MTPPPRNPHPSHQPIPDPPIPTPLQQQIDRIEANVNYLRTVVEALVGSMKAAQAQPGMAGMMARMMPVPALVTPPTARTGI